MPGILRLLDWVASELNPQREAQCFCEGEPHLERRTGDRAALKLRDSRLRQIDFRGQCCLTPPAALPRSADRRTEFQRQSGGAPPALKSGHSTTGPITPWHESDF
jgi:hypothetical protein